MNNDSEPQELPPHKLNELVGCAKQAWARIPRGALKAPFEWDGRQYVASYASFRLQIHTVGGIRIHF